MARKKASSKRKAAPKSGAASARSDSSAEHVLPADAVEDARVIRQLIELKQERIGRMQAEIREAMLELHDEAREAWLRLASRIGVEVTEDQVVGLTDDNARLRVVSKEQAKREIEARRKGRG